MTLTWLGYPASLAMGLTLGLVGGGGSILTVPILAYLFALPALESTSYSLLLVGLLALVGALQAWRAGNLRLSVVLFFGLPGALSVAAMRAFVVPEIPAALGIGSWTLSRDALILGLFAILMILASRALLKDRREESTSATVSSPHPLSLVGLGASVGALVGFVGAGGGFLIVPALVRLGGLGMRQAVGSSLAIIALQSLSGAWGDPALARMEYSRVLGWVLACAFLGLAFGMHYRNQVPAQRLKKIFGIFVLLMGSVVLIKELTKGML